MKLSISNIAWGPDRDQEVYGLMRQYGFTGLEIAPTRILPETPYDRLEEADVCSRQLREEYGLCVPSMQSIWFGRTEKLFGTDHEREALLQYTKKAIDFAEAIGCGNLVFGCPRNRSLPGNITPAAAAKQAETAVVFLKPSETMQKSTARSSAWRPIRRSITRITSTIRPRPLN